MIWQVTARFTIFGHACPEVDLTPVLGLLLLGTIVALLIAQT